MTDESPKLLLGTKDNITTVLEASTLRAPRSRMLLKLLLLLIRPFLFSSAQLHLVTETLKCLDHKDAWHGDISLPHMGYAEACTFVLPASNSIQPQVMIMYSTCWPNLTTFEIKYLQYPSNSWACCLSVPLWGGGSHGISVSAST